MFARLVRSAGKPKQCFNGLNLSFDSPGLGVMIHHQLLNEARDDPFVSRLVATGILDVVLSNEVHIHSLPKSDGFKLKILFKSGHFLSTICPREARLAWDSAGRKCKLSAPCAPVGGWHSHRYGEKKVNWGWLW
jgi:hypothetical protein